MSLIKRGRSVLLLALALVAARAQGANFGAGDVTGTVLWNGSFVTGQAASRMYVYIPAVSAAGSVSQADGTYSMKAVAPGTYPIKVIALGCGGEDEVATGSVTITANASTTVNFDLTSLAGIVRGKVTLDSGTFPSPQIRFYSCGPAPVDSSGNFAQYIAAGTYSGTVRGSSGVLGTIPATVTAGAITDVGTVNFQSATITGAVSYAGAAPSGLPAQNLYAYIASVSAANKVSASGTFSLGSLPPGTYTVGLLSQGCGGGDLIATASVTVAAGQTAIQNFDLTPLVGVVQGAVTLDGAPLANPTVKFINGCQAAPNDSSGHFAQYLLPGSYTAPVSGPGGALGQVSATISAGQTTDLSTVGFTTGSITGAVTYVGAPLSNGGNLYVGVPANSTGSFVDGSGHYSITKLVTGTYAMQVYSLGCGGGDTVAQASVNVASGSATTKNFDLSTVAGRVVGTITVNGTPLPNPGVRIGSGCTIPSDSAGVFRGYLPPGSYVATVSGPGGVLGSFPFTVGAGQTTNLDVASTPAGSNVKFTAGGGLATTGGVELTFSTVTTAGSTTIVTTGAGTPPTGYRVIGTGGQPLFYDVTTSATFNPPLGVCVKYDPADVHVAQGRLSMRDVKNSYADITTSIDVTNKIICGAAASASQFAVLEPIPLAISPTTAAVLTGGASQFTASGGSGTGYAYSVSTNNSGATISASGLYTAGAKGGVSDTVTATDSIANTATATVTVTAGVAISPGSMNIPPKGTVQFHASGGSATGYVWSILTNGSGATINAAGVYSGGPGPNTTDVVQVADSLGNTATVTLTVGPGITLTPPSISLSPRASQKFTAVGGSGAGYTWKLTAASTSGGAVGPASGVYTAGNTGSSSDVVQCTDSFGNTATAAATVTAGVSITPPSGPVSPRSTLQLVASGGSGSGFTWVLLTNGSGATLSAAGFYTAGPTGSVKDVIQVTDSLGNVFFLTINVAAGPTISPLGGPVSPRGVVQLATSGGSGGGYTYLLTTNGSGGSVSAAGLYTAGPTGGTTDVVTVTDALGNSSTAAFNVTGGIKLSPASASLAPKSTAQLTVSGGSGAGYLWSLSVNGSGATISQAGLYTAGATGSSSDTVKVLDSLNNSGTSVLFVSAGVSISPATAPIAPKASKQLQAAGGSGQGFKWTFASNPSGATLSATGLYTAGAAGGTTDVVMVTDSLCNFGTSTLTVTAGISITPATLTVSPRKVQQLSAAGGSGAGYAFTLVTSGSGGSITADGFYAAGVNGSTTDKVSVTDSLGNTGSVVITVNAALAVTPADVSVAPRQSKTFTAAGGSGAGFTWAVAINGSGSTIDAATGAYTAGPKGGVVELVTCTDSLGNTASAIVTVGPGVTVTPAFANVPPRGRQQLTVRGGNGAYTYAIVSTNGSGGSISAAGLYTAGSTAATIDTLKVTDSLGNFALASMSVTDALAVLPNAVTVAPRATRSFSAAGGAGSGFTWTLSTNGSGATVIASTDGVTASYTAGAKGNAADVLTVTDGLGNAAMGAITVGPVITVTPATASLAPRAQQKLNATGGLGTFRWRVLPGGTSGGSVSSTGIYTAGTADTSQNTTDTVEASDALGNAATAVMTVTTGLVVTPAGVSLAPRASQVFTAAGGTGAQISFTLSVNQSGGSVTADGRYLAGPRGGATDVVKASDNLGNSATATVTVTAGLVVNPETTTLPPKGKQQLAATGGNGIYTWTLLASSGSGGTVSTSGLYTAGPTGVTTDTVKVTDSVGNSATASFNVTVGLSVTPDKASVAAKGGKASFTAAGGAGAEKGYTWSISTNLSGGTIDDKGNYLSGAAGNVKDVVQVVDAVGNVATVTVEVAPLPAAASGCSTAEGSLLPQLLVAGLGVLWRRRRRRRAGQGQ